MLERNFNGFSVQVKVGTISSALDEKSKADKESELNQKGLEGESQERLTYELQEQFA